MSPPRPTAPPSLRPVRPLDAGSLLLVRPGNDGPEILMGRRPPKSAFIPDAFVFPGGKVDAGDRHAHPGSRLSPVISTRLATASPTSARALAMAAVRETFEETGLLLGERGDVGHSSHESWQRIRALGQAPALARLDYLGRAITPTNSPIRFHARFFVAEASHASGHLKSNGELADLHWVALSKADRLPVVDVTEFMIHELRRRLARPDGEDRRQVLFSYRRGQPAPRYF